MELNDRNTIFDPDRILLGLGYACALLVVIGWIATLPA